MLVASCGSLIGPVDDAVAVSRSFAMFSFPIGTKMALCPWGKGAHRESGPIGAICSGEKAFWELDGANSGHFSDSPLSSAEHCKPRTDALNCADDLRMITEPVLR